MEPIIRTIRSVIPTPFFSALQPLYHRVLAVLGAFLYWFPSRSIYVIGVTGTKGKSTVIELLASILESAGKKVALSSTIRFKVGNESKRNLHKMTMPGRLFVQKFLRQAVSEKCDVAILEMTSEGVKQFRHKYIALDALVFTNLSPEHVESHGSFENYRDAKRALGRQLEKSGKKEKVVVANADDEEGDYYLGLSVEKSTPFSLHHAKPLQETATGYTFTFRGTLINLALPGRFNIYNALAAATLAASVGVDTKHIKSGIETVSSVPGRVEYIQKEPFAVVVDYAHTIDSLSQFYSIFANQKNICVLGNTGGGRDTWKRPKMARVAEEHCTHIILTNEDPYDENPESILKEMATGIGDKNKFEIIMDRRQAIARALNLAQPGDNVLITGKGTDPYIMGAKGNKQPWDDGTVVREEFENLKKRGTKEK